MLGSAWRISRSLTLFAALCLARSALADGPEVLTEDANYFNSRAQFQLTIPAKFQQVTQSMNGDGFHAGPDDGSFILRAWGCDHAGMCDFEADWTRSSKDATYKVKKTDWYVASGVTAGRVFYEKEMTRAGVTATFRLEFPEASKKEFDPVVAQLVKSFQFASSTGVDRIQPVERTQPSAVGPVRGVTDPLEQQARRRFQTAVLAGREPFDLCAQEAKVAGRDVLSKDCERKSLAGLHEAIASTQQWSDFLEQHPNSGTATERANIKEALLSLKRFVQIWEADGFAAAAAATRELMGISADQLAGDSIAAQAARAVGSSRSTSGSASQPPASAGLRNEVSRWQGSFAEESDPKYLHTVTLTVNDAAVSGSYFYARSRKPIDLKGSRAGNTFIIDELNAGRVVATFKGSVDAAGTTASGSWAMSDGSKRLTFKWTREP